MANFISKIANLFKKSKPLIKSDEFDDKFGFMLKHNIVETKDYNRVKSHYRQFYLKSE